MALANRLWFLRLLLRFKHWRNHRRTIRELDEAASATDEYDFKREQTYTRYLRAEEIHTYGRTFDREQRETLHDLEALLPKHLRLSIVLSGYINGRGKIVINWVVESILILTTTALALAMTAWFIGTTYTLVSNTAPYGLVIHTISLLALLVSLYLLDQATRPLRAWRKIARSQRAFKNIGGSSNE